MSRSSCADGPARRARRAFSGLRRRWRSRLPHHPAPGAAPAGPPPDLQRQRRQRFRLLGGLLLALLAAHSLGLLALPGLARLDRALQDAQVRLAAPRTLDPQLVVVEIDERAVAAHGRWPWHRQQLATLIDHLVVDDGARLVALDLLLTEPDPGGGLAVLDRLALGPLAQLRGGPAALQALRPQLDDDARLASTLARQPVLLGFHLDNRPGATLLGELPTPWAETAALDAHAAAWPDWPGRSGSLATLQQAARLGGGHLNAEVDSDGVLRQAVLLARHQGGVQPALALAVARADLARANPAAVTWRLLPAQPPLRGLQLDAGPRRLSLPLGPDARVRLPFRAAGAIARVSAADVLSGALPADALRGRIALVGVSVAGLASQHATPVDAAMSGTLVQAHLLSGLLEGRLRVVPAEAGLLATAALLLAGALLLPWLPRLGLWRAALLGGGVLLALLGIQALAWSGPGWVLPLAAPLALPLLLVGLHAVLTYRASGAARQHLQRLFGQYVPPELVAEMAQAPERHTMRSRQAELTVLFADVRGFTTLAERMGPEDLGAMMNLLLSRLTDTVRAHRGTLDKYIGDCVMAFWGAPLDDPDHARHAVDAALAMRAQLPALQAELQARGWPALDIGIGLDTGVVVVGDMGSRHRLAYTVLGDTVNRAARLQDLASKNSLGLVVGDATRQAVGDGRCFIPLGPVALRGRDHALPAWQPLPQRPNEDAEADERCAAWAQLLALDAAGDRQQARLMLAALEDKHPGCPRCAFQRQRWAAIG